MKKRHLIGAALAAAALSGCDGGEERTAQGRSIAPANPFVEQLKGLSEANQGLALRRAIQDARNYCKKVTQSGYQEDYKNMSVWVARCLPGGDFMLFIAPNGDVQVRTCKDTELLGLPKCRFEEEPAPKGADPKP